MLACCRILADVNDARRAACQFRALECPCANSEQAVLIASIVAAETAADCPPALASEDGTPCECAAVIVDCLTANLWEIEDASPESPEFGLYARGVAALVGFLVKAERTLATLAREKKAPRVVHPEWISPGTVESIYALTAVEPTASGPGSDDAIAAVRELHARLASVALDLWPGVAGAPEAVVAVIDFAIARSRSKINILRMVHKNVWDGVSTVFMHNAALVNYANTARVMDECMRVLVSECDFDQVMMLHRAVALSITLSVAAADVDQTEALIGSGILHVYRALLGSNTLEKLRSRIPYTSDAGETIADEIAFAAANVALGCREHAEAVAGAGCINAVFSAAGVTAATKLMFAEAFLQASAPDDLVMAFKDSGAAMETLASLAFAKTSTVEHAAAAATFYKRSLSRELLAFDNGSEQLPALETVRDARDRVKQLSSALSAATALLKERASLFDPAL